MKKLFLIRHAKSNWDNPELSDFDRPINSRGERDAPFMGKVLKQNNFSPDLIIASPALRAITTAKRIANEIGYDSLGIIENNRLYDASTGEILKVIESIDNKFNFVFLVAHNPGITLLNNYLNSLKVDNLSTCAITGIEFNTDDWGKIEEVKGKSCFYEFPKMYFD
ncbi:MAG: histidine phosphatase family protein [Melioribacteraceae bacterium]